MIMYRHPSIKIDIEDKSGPSPIIKNSPEKDEYVIMRGKTKSTFHDSAGVYVSDGVNIRDSVIVKPFFKEDKNNGTDNNDRNKEG